MTGRRTFRDRFTEAVWEQNALRPNEILIALAYAKYAGAKDNGNRAPEDVSWVAWEHLSTMTGIRSRDGISRATRGLIDAGWMTQIEPPRQHRAPRYRLTIPDKPDVRHTYSCEDAG